MRFGIYFPGETTDADQPRKLERRSFPVNGIRLHSESIQQQQVEFETSAYRHVLGFQLWKHTATPFGVTAARIESQAFRSDRLEWTFRRNYELMQFGNDAATELPNRN